MLKLEHIDQAVAYWTEQFNATILQSRRNDQNEYQSAFVALGNGTVASSKDSFALELVAAAANTVDMGNSLAYIGISRLRQFQGVRNLEAIVSGSAAGASSSLAAEPNGLPVQWATASPGDYLCRIGLRTNDIDATLGFYKDLMGMDVVAADDSMLCLRYSASATSGVPTTLVFEGTNEPLQHGTCLDHLVIRTRARIEEEHERLKQASVPVFLKPAKMFGSAVMGVKYPNGYRIVLAEEIE